MESHLLQLVVFQRSYQQYQNAHTASNHQAINVTEAWFPSVSARLVPCIIWDLPHVAAYDRHRPNILHTIYINMFDHFTTYQMANATDSIADRHMKDQKMNPKATPAIKDEETAKWEEALSRAKMEQQKPEDKKGSQDVYHSMVHKHTSFSFLKVHFMLHYEESVQLCRHIGKDSTKTKEQTNSKICIGPYC